MVLTDYGVLDLKYHAKLIQDLERISLDSGVPVRMIKTSATKYCSDTQLEWLKSYREQESLCLHGEPSVSPEMQMMAMAGALVRNYVDAKVVTIHSLLEGEAPDPTVLFIPNLYTITDGKVLTSWQALAIHEILLNRFLRDKKTVVYVENMDGLSKAYGKAFHRHLQEAYTQLGIQQC